MTTEEFTARYMPQFSEQQKAAVRETEGPVLLLAVPGSGKTTVLVTRLGYMALCRGIDPAHILAVTYTVAATRELRARFTARFPELAGQTPEFRTINGLSSKIIEACGRQRGPAFALQENAGELAALVGRIYQALNGDYPTDSTIREVRTAITYCKNMMLSADEIAAQDFGLPRFSELYTHYCAALREARQMDYDDQMAYALAILRKQPEILAEFQARYPYLCVDESQDTSRVQHAIIELLAKKTGNLFMVGDEDQSIYGFRAAYPEALFFGLAGRKDAAAGGQLPLHAGNSAAGGRIHRGEPGSLPQNHPRDKGEGLPGAPCARSLPAGAVPLSAGAGRGAARVVCRPVPKQRQRPSAHRRAGARRASVPLPQL